MSTESPVTPGQANSTSGQSFTEQLDAKSLEIFNAACETSFADQCVFFLNAFWQEYGDQAEFIFAVHYDIMRKTDMAAKGVNYVHLYEEGCDVDLNFGFYFFEKLCKFVEEGGLPLDKDHKHWIEKKENADWKEKYEPSFPEMKTAVVRKKELREEVDVNFDGRVSMLEYLLYQYKATPKDLIERSTCTDENAEIKAAKAALAEVQRAINEYEAEKHRLTEASELPGVKGLRAKNELAQLESGPLAEKLNEALIRAEAAVRKAIRNAGKSVAGALDGGAAGGQPRTDGATWWLQRELADKKEKYGKK